MTKFQRKKLVIISLLLLLAFTGTYLNACAIEVPPVVKQYTLKYARGAMDATGDIPSATQHNASAKIVLAPFNTFVRNNYEFVCWNDGENNYDAGAIYTMPQHDVTLTAIWKEANQQEEDPCIDGHDYKDGVCTRCNTPDPNYVPAEPEPEQPEKPDPEQPEEPEEPEQPEPTANPMLHADGTKVVDKYGNEIYLRGTNVGGYLVTENWMNAFQGAEDYYSIKKVLISRFGATQAEKLWQTYRENWWTDVDFQICADMGMNVLRLPFTYMDVDASALDNLANGGKNYDFSVLDDFVTRAAKYGLYVILDLHGAYGSHNGQDHSGQILGEGQVDFYHNQTKIDLTVKLWTALATHFKDNATVAGYDILNEPGENGGWINDTVGNAPHWDVFDKIYKAIRSVDEQHMVIFESSWGANNLPSPDVYGWTNCMYSFHHYNNITDNPSAFAQSYNDKIAELTNKNFGVPLQMGEFTAYSNESQWRYALQALNDNNFHWCSWTFKINGNHSSWGIVNKGYSSKVNVQSDSYQDIVAKFTAMKTVGTGEYYRFASGTTLRMLFEEALDSAVNLNQQINGVTVVRKDGKAYLAINGTYNTSVSDSVALGALQNAFYADCQRNNDAGGAGTGWEMIATYQLGQDASISASGGTYQILLDLSAVKKGYNVFFHVDTSTNNLVCANVEGQVTVDGKTYSAGIYSGWGSNLVMITVS